MNRSSSWTKNTIDYCLQIFWIAQRLSPTDSHHFRVVTNSSDPSVTSYESIRGTPVRRWPTGRIQARRRKNCPTAPHLGHRLVDAHAAPSTDRDRPADVRHARRRALHQAGGNGARVQDFTGFSDVSDVSAALYRRPLGRCWKSQSGRLLLPGAPRIGGGKSGGLLLPGALRTAGIPFCCPAGSNRAFVLVTSGR